MDRTMEMILSRVQKPARYTGGEYNAVVKDRRSVDTRVALCFPDTYEIGMSNLGVRILYGLMNEQEGVWCERVFAPWGDMEAEMRREGLSLYGLESGDPISGFDVIGFSLGYELAYTNVLNMLDLAGLPLRTADRGEESPLIIAGGTCAYNSEPLAPFIDIFCLGEGEDVLLELLELYRRARNEGWRRRELLVAAARIPGLYVPSLYEVTYGEDGVVTAVTPTEGAPSVVTKRIVQDFEHSYFPTKTIVPSTEIVHDRVMLEVFRGCIRGCRFCQAGYAYRPVRPRSPQRLLEQGIAACRDSGYQEMTLSSLSTSDYRPLEGLCDGLLDWCEPHKVSLSLPSLRADNFSMGLMERLQHVRKSGLTFAPEAGTQRLRDAINKNVTEEDLLTSCRTAFSGGWSSVKLYFMLGLPTETDEDVLGIAELARKVLQVWRDVTPNRRRGCRITVSTACFVPKPHTAFQWEPQVEREEYLRRVKLLRDNMREKSITYHWHDPETSFLEAVFSRGDRRLADAIEAAWRDGAKFDSWSEYFSLERWLKALAACGLDPAFYANRTRSRDEVLPWSCVSTGVRTEFLWRERELAYQARITPDCRKQCTGCGADKLYTGGICDA
ncbi:MULTISPECIES: TIGR03960 family B12-binding radical SAM protein [Intestinimonas]|uniref:TIGR03960 family B12-binding radical SAM protein n=1 Tax=Intestinimonas TaxID=1392389 RepID=UPI00067F5C61|nr:MULTISPECIES: TIGR03960 family B12-binding radical SAM protein [Intestinimonas]MCI5562077.1 TIGR03960 family B12-binding radical SAM protein [Intestinimonas massiliensis (ex Afouda et al. 2020)]MDY5340080.1 TIGR03960 family B12-binding radical SAM protein [Intestinimonas sp.]